MKPFRLIFPLLAVAGFTLRAPAQFANGIKAIVQDSIITLAEVEQYAKPAAEALLRQYRGQPQTFQQKLAGEMDKGLEELIERELVLYDFKSAGYNFPEAIIDDGFQQRVVDLLQDDAHRCAAQFQIAFWRSAAEDEDAFDAIDALVVGCLEPCGE